MGFNSGFKGLMGLLYLQCAFSLSRIVHAFCRILTFSNHHFHTRPTMLSLTRAYRNLNAVRTAYLHIILPDFSLRKVLLNFVCPHAQFCCLLHSSHQQLSLSSSSIMMDRQASDYHHSHCVSATDRFLHRSSQALTIVICVTYFKSGHDRILAHPFPFNIR